MGKDRYSDDHTLEVVGGTNTVIISDNLTVSGDLNISGTVSGSANFSSVPVLSSAATRYRSYSAASFTWDNVAGAFNQIPIITEGVWLNDQNGAARTFYCSISDIPDGSTITGYEISYMPKDGGDSIISRLFSRDLDVGVEATGAMLEESTLSSSPQDIYLLEESSSISEVIDYENKIYYIAVELIPGSSDGIYLKGLKLKYTSNSVGL